MLGLPLVVFAIILTLTYYLMAHEPVIAADANTHVLGARRATRRVAEPAM
jgi:hypothetical protein